MGFNLESVMNEDSLSGLDTKSAGYTIQLKVNYGPNAPGAPYRVNTFTHYDKAVVLRNNSVQVSE